MTQNDPTLADRLDRCRELVAAKEADDAVEAEAARLTRLGYTEAAPEVLAAARLIGMHPREIESIVEHASGDVVIRTRRDGVEMICVDPSNPDGAGRSGLLLYTRRSREIIKRFTPRPAPAPASAIAAEADEAAR